MGKRFYEEGVSTNENFSQEDFAEMVKDAALDTAVNTVNLISVLEPKAIEAEEVQAISDATGSTPEYVENVVDATDQATEAFSEVQNEEESQFVAQSFSELIDKVTEENFSALQESVVNFSQNFSQNFDAEKVVENVVKIAGVIDPKAIENLGKDKVVEVISEATKVPEDTTEEIVDAVTGCEECDSDNYSDSEDSENYSEEDFQENFAAKVKSAAKKGVKNAKKGAVMTKVTKAIKYAKTKAKALGKYTAEKSNDLAKSYDKALGKIYNSTIGKIPTAGYEQVNKYSKGGKKIIEKTSAKEYGRTWSKLGKNTKLGIKIGAPVVAGAAAYGAVKSLFGGKKQNYSDVTLYTQDGIPVHFDNLEVEVDEQSMPEMPNPNPVVNNGGILTPVTPEDAATNPVVQQTPADAAQDPKVGMAPSDDASQALAAAAMKQDLVTAKTVAGTEPATVNASSESSQFSVLDGIVESIEDGSLK